MNKMPNVMPRDLEQIHLKSCVPYLARNKSSGELVTVLRTDDRVVYITSDTTSNSNIAYFRSAYEIIREFIKGQDTVTIAAW